MTNTVHLIETERPALHRQPDTEVTGMNHIEISVKLAYAIGWQPHQVRIISDEVFLIENGVKRLFDYRDPLIIWKIAATYDAFPMESASAVDRGWVASSGKSAKVKSSKASTPELASALAIIEVAKENVKI